VERLQPGTPAEPATLARKAMARNPAERFASAKPRADELERFTIPSTSSAMALVWSFP
jgi:hypothetical protein